ncbi:MAG: UDP-N-acetylmuramoyl-L-alanyl-D-glutamate--2,6-diaminopimelate ligase [Legionellales bacterium]|nr:UDP-N-acetylmuramoyl-L-alanyl-D-glutamate--2,6-diaminopimelate ligase [Legionellales bacterium]|tara:strand:- start:243 stop:1736 length:1494 start_codon:yes stop_codon:yes gene_type:complete
MKLKTLCENFIKLRSEDENIIVKGLAIDSRQVKPGDLFFAVPGLKYDGISFIPQAVANGAVAILCEESMDVFSQVDIETTAGRKVPVYAISHLLLKIGSFAACFYHNPSSKIELIGVTGTNGKSSIVYFLTMALNKLNKKTAMLGTLGNGYQQKLLQSSHTTLDAVTLQNILHQFIEDKVACVAMEVSSHGLSQGRVNGCDIDIAVFTNLTHEHLDYHGDMHHYGQAKRKLFLMPKLRHAIFNIDDDFGANLFQEFKSSLTCYAISLHSTHMQIDKKQLISAKNIELSSEGLFFDVSSPWGEARIHTSLYGKFNILNLLSTIACLGIQGYTWSEIQNVMHELSGVPGRMQVLRQENKPVAVIDYAHTPDALKNALQALRQHNFGKIWCVFGCGGDRDSSKRSIMGEIAEQYADNVIITNDNPRTEDPMMIAQQIKVSMIDQQVQIILDRKAAIIKALSQAKQGDVVLIAGKGHEQYQEINQVKSDFSDEKIVQDFWF